MAESVQGLSVHCQDLVPWTWVQEQVQEQQPTFQQLVVVAGLAGGEDSFDKYPNVSFGRIPAAHYGEPKGLLPVALLKRNLGVSEVKKEEQDSKRTKGGDRWGKWTV